MWARLAVIGVSFCRRSKRLGEYDKIEAIRTLFHSVNFIHKSIRLLWLVFRVDFYDYTPPGSTFTPLGQPNIDDVEYDGVTM